MQQQCLEPKQKSAKGSKFKEDDRALPLLLPLWGFFIEVLPPDKNKPYTRK